MRRKNVIDDKIVKYSIILLSIAIIFFCGLVFIENNQIKHVSNNYETNDAIRWSIDEVNEKMIYYTIKGWAFSPDTNNKGVFMTYVLLRNTKTNSYIQINTDKRANWAYVDPDTQQNYHNVGFVATINKYLLNKDTDYEICILYTHRNIKNIVFTNKIIDM